MTRPKTVALIEFGWSGHLPNYFRFFCEALLACGHRVLALCPGAHEIAAWAQDQGLDREGKLVSVELIDRVLARRWVRKVPQLATQFRFRQCARLLAEQQAVLGCRIDLVFFASLYNGIAPYFNQTSKIFPYPWTGLLLDSGCVRLAGGPRLWLQYRSFDPLALFREQNCVSVATLDGFVKNEIGRRIGGKPVHVLPEVTGNPSIVISQLVESFRAQAAGRPIIGCFGQFARRKGVLDFLRLAQSCEREPWFFVWAGQMEERSFTRSELRWVETFLASRPANCRVELDRISDGEFDGLISSSSLLYLCYHRHVGSSNMIGKAASLGKRVLVSEGYCMADQTKYYNLGLCVPEGNPDAKKAAIRILLDSSNSLPTPRFDAYLHDHSQTRFMEAMTAITSTAKEVSDENAGAVRLCAPTDRTPR